MAYVTIEDTSGSLELLVFERALSQGAAYLQADQPVIVYGRISAREEEEPKLMTEEVYPLNDNYASRYREIRRSASRTWQSRGQETPAPPRPAPRTDAQPAPATGGKTLWVKMSSLNDARMDYVKQAFQQNPGGDKAILYVLDRKQKMQWQGGVNAPDAMNALTGLIGAKNVAIR